MVLIKISFGTKIDDISTVFPCTFQNWNGNLFSSKGKWAPLWCAKEKAVVGVRLRHVLRWFEKMCFKNRIWNVPLISTYKIQYCRLEFTFFENVLVSHSIYPGFRRPSPIGVAFLDPPSKLRLERESCASSYRTLDLSLDILVLGVLWK